MQPFTATYFFLRLQDQQALRGRTEAHRAQRGLSAGLLLLRGDSLGFFNSRLFLSFFISPTALIPATSSVTPPQRVCSMSDQKSFAEMEKGDRGGAALRRESLPLTTRIFLITNWPFTHRGDHTRRVSARFLWVACCADFSPRSQQSPARHQPARFPDLPQEDRKPRYAVCLTPEENSGSPTRNSQQDLSD